MSHLWLIKKNSNPFSFPTKPGPCYPGYGVSGFYHGAKKMDP